MQAGQVPVENDHVVPVEAHVRERLQAVKHKVDRHPFPAEPVPERRGQPTVIFHHKHTHRYSMHNEGDSAVTGCDRPVTVPSLQLAA